MTQSHREAVTQTEITPEMIARASVVLRDWLGTGRSDQWTTQVQISHILGEILSVALSTRRKA